MWDTGSYLMAAVSAQRLGIITRDELNARVNAVLTTLSSLPLADGQLPSLYYHTQRSIRLNSLSQNESQPDWSAVDISRLLMALDIVAWLYPEQTAAIARLTAPWRFDALFMQQEPQQPLNFRAAKKWQFVTQGNRDSYGYQLYAVNGLRRVSPWPPSFSVHNSPRRAPSVLTACVFPTTAWSKSARSITRSLPPCPIC